jgi:oligosaccharide repeat unit polymerase
MTSVSPGILIIFSLLLLLTVAMRVKEGTWYSPFSFLGLLWSFIIGFSVYTAPEYFFSPAALGFIVVNIFIFCAGGFISEKFFKKAAAARPRPPQGPSSGLLRLHYYAAIIAGILSLFFLLHDAGVQFMDLFDAKRLAEISRSLTDNRYAGERLSPMTMLCLMIAYSGCMTAGRLFIFSRDIKGKLKSVLILIPVLLFTIIYTARAVFLFAMLLFVSSLITHYVLLYKREALLFSKRNILFILAAFVVVPLIFLFTQAMRMGISKLSIDNLETITEHLKVYFSGNLSAYSFWFSQPCTHEGLHFGAFTFAGLHEWIGGGSRDLGIYNKAIDLNGRMQFSNIYTLFRFLMDDFGIAGTMICWFALGILCRGIYEKILKHDLVASAVLAGMFTWILFSFITSVFAYNTVLFAWMIFVLITFAAEKFSVNEK